MLIQITDIHIDTYRANLRNPKHRGYLESPIEMALRIATGGEWMTNRFDARPNGSINDHGILERQNLEPIRCALPVSITAMIDSGNWQPITVDLLCARPEHGFTNPADELAYVETMCHAKTGLLDYPVWAARKRKIEAEFDY